MAEEKQDADPPELRLRAAPRPVTRLKGARMGLLAVLAGCVLLVLIARGFRHGREEATPPDKQKAMHPRALPWMLAALPASYDHIKNAIAALGGPRAPGPFPPALAPPQGPLAAPGREIPSLSQVARNKAQEAARAARAGVFFTRIAQGKSAKTRGAVRGKQSPAGAGAFAAGYALLAGTIIPASLITGLKSDLPGPVLAQISQNVYDSISGAHLLLPQGARLIGSYDNHIAYGQSRVRVVFSRVILPDGTSFALGHLPASDEAGYVGLTGGVDDHLFRLLKGASLSSLLGIAAEQGLGLGNSLLAQALRQSVISSANQGGQELVHKAINVAPTITVPPGTPLTVVVEKTLVLPAFRG